MEAGTPHARYVILRSTSAGWDIAQCAIDYDIDSAAGFAERNGRPDVVRALRTGRV